MTKMNTSPSSKAVSAAFEKMLLSLGIPIDDTVFVNEARNLSVLESHHSKSTLTEGIDSLIDLLASVSDTIINIVATRIANLGKCRNQVAPLINQLPTDVFDHIISHFLPTPRNERHLYSDLGDLRTVCTSWAHRLRSNRRLWTFISVRVLDSNYPNMLERLLERSGCAPLTVQLDGSPSLIATPFISHAGRLQHLQIGDDSTGAVELMTRPMPVLESLTLGARRGHQSFPHIRNFLGGSAPQLRSIKTDKMLSLASADPPILSRLQDLDLYHIQNKDQGDATPSIITNILASCVSLKSLHITYLAPSSTSLMERPNSTVTLPTLETLHITGDAWPVAEFLKAIVPSYCSLRQISEVHRSWSFQTQRLPNLMRISSSFVSCNQGICIRVEDRRFCMQAYDAGPLPSIEIIRESTDLMQLLPLAIREAACKIIRIEIHGSLLRTPFFKQVTDTMPAIEEVAFRTTQSYGITIEDMKKVVYASRRHARTQSPATSLRCLQVWKGDRWEEKLEEVIRALDANNVAMVIE